MMPRVPDAERGPREARVTTRTGDAGETSLFGEGRVPKTDPRVSALGDLDEAQAALGVARALAGVRADRGRESEAPSAPTGVSSSRDIASVPEQILELQRGLYLAMAEVATPPERLARLERRLGADAVASLDRMSETLRLGVDITGRFVVPGEDPLSAALDVARTVIRRAERSVVALVAAETIDGTALLPWLNRLSDVVFVLSRRVEPAARPASSGGDGP
jgi:cob(I)alamin adenosyltransferase